MNKPILLSNLRIEDLNEETDYLGMIQKGIIIKDFLIGSTDRFDEIKMFSLYGDWGSGKSTLMKFLQKELRGDFNTFFFESWEFEKDENLAMSLLEFMAFKTQDTSEELYKDILKYGGRVLRGLGKSVKVNIPLFPNGPAIEVDPSCLIEEISKNEELTFYEALKNLKIKFKRLEDHITREGFPDYNIVFIDDLDRCEPQQVLNLMSAIKLFFTYGSKTIFFCGVDKKAVEEAVNTRYGKVVKANEYLEKIFDISFSMPKNIDLFKLINHYFDDTNYDLNHDEEAINHRISNFLHELEFTNPRRVKKILNKFQMFRDFSKISKEIDFPNIDMKDGVKNSYFDTILVIYLIILHEFHPDEFENFLNFEIKKSDYTGNLDTKDLENGLNIFLELNHSNKKFGKIHQDLIDMRNSSGTLEPYFYVCLSPNNLKKITKAALYFNSFASITISEKNIDYLFYKFVNKVEVVHWLKYSKYNSSLLSIKSIVQNLF